MATSSSLGNEPRPLGLEESYFLPLTLSMRHGPDRVLDTFTPLTSAVIGGDYTSVG